MRLCCPRNRGCNSHEGGQPCVLTIFREAARTSEEARLAVDRWEALEAVEREGARAGERRFRRRAYERAREQALTVVAIDLAAETPTGAPTVRRRRSRSHAVHGSGPGHGPVAPAAPLRA